MSRPGAGGASPCRRPAETPACRVAQMKSGCFVEKEQRRYRPGCFAR